MKKIAVFPGSFDPFSVGHQNIVERALPLFDEIIVAIGENSQKKYLLSLEKRKDIIKQTFSGNEKVSVASYEGLTSEFCKSVGSSYLLRGIRNARDLDFEQSIAQMNQEISPGLETIFLVNEPRFSAINSSIIREIYINGGDVSKFIPKGISLEE